MRKKTLIIGGLVLALGAGYYFYIYNIDAKKARVILAGAGKTLRPTMSEEFVINWARSCRLMIFNTFTYLGNSYNTSDGLPVGYKMGANGLPAVQNDAINSSLNEKQAFIMSRGY